MNRRAYLLFITLFLIGISAYTVPIIINRTPNPIAEDRELLIPNQALLIIGEVNNDEGKPKLFPQEIMPLDEAPRRYTTQVHFRLNAAHLSPQRLDEARVLAESHRGRVPLFLCIRRTAGELVFIEAHERWNVAPSMAFQKAVDEMFGEETYYAKVDTAVPERQRKPWEKRNGNGDGGGDE